MAIGAVVLLTAAAVLGRVGADYGRISGDVGAGREARAAISQLTADAATARPAAGQVFETATTPAGWARSRIGFLCLQPALAQSDDRRIGDLCAVTYYVADLATGGTTVRCVMRGFRDSADTFAAVRDDQPAGLFVPSPRDEPVAFGVVAFEARPLVRAADGSWQDWSPPAGTATAGEPAAAASPQALQLRLVVAQRELLAKLTTSGDWDGDGPAGQLLGRPADASTHRHLQVFESLIRHGQP